MSNNTHDIKNSTTILGSISKYAPNGEVLAFIDDDKSGLQVGLTKSSKQKRLCVVFRGSEEPRDWYHNAQFRKRRIEQNNVYVHQGFYKQLYDNGNYDKISKLLSDEIKKNPDFEVYILGHSLGASLSTLFGYIYSKETDHLITILSFASPRVGNLKFKKEFQKRSNLIHYRFTNKRDIVPALPILRYHHTGYHIHMDGEMFKKGRGNSLLTSWSIQDHNIKSYYDNLKSARGWDKVMKKIII
jgi:triacylglycerol lipase